MKSFFLENKETFLHLESIIDTAHKLKKKCMAIFLIKYMGILKYLTRIVNTE